MSIIAEVFRSSLGKKYLMAVSGFVLFLFVIGHLAGNLQIFLGPEALNRYGHFLQSNPELIWPARLILLVLLVVHIWAAARLSLENRAARPIGYAQYHPVASSYASRTMLMSGLIVFAFVVYHLLHFTVEVRYLNFTHQDFAAFVDPAKRHDIFKMMVIGFNNLWVSAFYIFGIALLCLHLSHGASSMFQSIGWKNQSYGPALDKGARLVALLIFVGYASIPAAIFLGYGREHLK